MAATWVIGDQESKYRAELGTEEYDRRLAIANAKADDLGKGDNWKEEAFMRPQFESVIMQLKPEQVATVEKWTGARFAKLIYKLAGVG